jgi:hypothetical protein
VSSLLRICRTSLAVLCCAAVAAAYNPNVYEPGHDPGVGFNLISWSSSVTGAQFAGAVQSIYNAGFREVSISPVRFTNINTGQIVSGPSSPSVAAISQGLAKAKELGMSVTLNPFWENYDPTDPNPYFADVVPGAADGCTWRGCFNPGPSIAGTFWTNYQAYLVEMANLAQTYNVDRLTVGTEYNALDADPTHNANWNAAINAVDAIYSGQIGYAANWDHFNHPNVTTAIWNHPAVDFVGIDAYFTGTTSNSQADASGTYPNQTFINQTTTGWSNRLNIDSAGNSLDGLLPFAAALNGGAGKPIIFTEVGYLPYNRTANNPQNSSGSIDTGEQIMAFLGLLRALDGKADVFPALHVWQWGMNGSNGSLWNIGLDNPSQPYQNANNRPLGQFLASYASNFQRPGDFNDDGQVNAADYTLWRDTLGSTTDLRADATGDGNIGPADYNVWAAEFSPAPPLSMSSSATVPEPSTSYLALLTCCVVARTRTRLTIFARKS